MARPMINCPQCGALVADIEGPRQAYVPGAPGCWAAFTELQADELQRLRNHSVQGLVVDAYMAQHPGNGLDRRDRQSVFVHLVGLCAVLERGWPSSRPLLARVTAARSEFPRLIRLDDPGRVTVTDLAGAVDAADYANRARAWADEVWRSWAPSHGVIRATVDQLEAGRSNDV
jgi:hypothetical protein